MTTHVIRFGRLIAQDECEYTEHSIVVQRFEGCVTIAQADREVIVQDEHIEEFIKAIRATAKVSP